MSKIEPGALLKVVKNSTIFPSGKGNDELVELFYGEQCVPAVILNKESEDRLMKKGSFKETEMHTLGDVLGMPLESVGVAIKEVKIILDSKDTDKDIQKQANHASVSSNMNTIQSLLYKLVLKCGSLVQRAWQKELHKIMESDRPPKPYSKHPLGKRTMRTMWLVLISDNQAVIESIKKTHGGIMNTGSIKTGIYLIDSSRLELTF